MNKRTIDLTGKRFGRLEVLSHAGSKSGKAAWNCVCDCGSKTVVIGKNMRNGFTKSCGCLKIEKMSERSRTHGLTKTPEYQAWLGIKKRCLNKNTRSYNRYGGRGIKMCDRWARWFPHFLEDMGPRPSPKHSVERIDNDGDYCPENCKWATPEEQANNKSTSTHITIGVCTKTPAQWAKISGIDEGTIAWRNRQGWEPADAVFSEKQSNQPSAK